MNEFEIKLVPNKIKLTSPPPQNSNGPPLRMSGEN